MTRTAAAYPSACVRAANAAMRLTKPYKCVELDLREDVQLSFHGCIENGPPSLVVLSGQPIGDLGGLQIGELPANTAPEVLWVEVIRILSL